MIQVSQKQICLQVLWWRMWLFDCWAWNPLSFCPNTPMVCRMNSAALQIMTAFCWIRMTELCPFSFVFLCKCVYMRVYMRACLWMHIKLLNPYWLPALTCFVVIFNVFVNNSCHCTSMALGNTNKNKRMLHQNVFTVLWSYTSSVSITTVCFFSYFISVYFAFCCHLFYRILMTYWVGSDRWITLLLL